MKPKQVKPVKHKGHCFLDKDGNFWPGTNATTEVLSKEFAKRLFSMPEVTLNTWGKVVPIIITEIKRKGKKCSK